MEGSSSYLIPAENHKDGDEVSEFLNSFGFVLIKSNTVAAFLGGEKEKFSILMLYEYDYYPEFFLLIPHVC